jgi:excisionase family DNA binding protein
MGQVTQPASHVRMVTAVEAAERLGVSRRTVLRMVNRGEFPKPHVITVKSFRWPETTVDQWLDSRNPESEQESA